jgi:DNA polymerase III epsilon subunit-like protein
VQAPIGPVRAWKEAYGLPMRYRAVDVETTGLDQIKDRIINLGWCVGSVSPSDPGLERFILIDWTRVLSTPELQDMATRMERTRKAMEDKGLDYRWSIDELRAHGVSPHEAVEAFLSACAGHPLVAHYGWKFDYPLIGRLAAAYGPGLDVNVTDLIDTGLMVKAVMNSTRPYAGEEFRTFVNRINAERAGLHSMRTCVERYRLDRYGVHASHQHDAGYDAWLAHLLYRQLWTDEFGPTPVP